MIMRYLAFAGAGGGGGELPIEVELDYGATPEKFGICCDISRDGSTVAIGDNLYNAVRVFTDPDADRTWPLLQEVTMPSGYTEFASTVSLNGDGTVMAVWGKKTSPSKGYVLVYDLSGGTYSLTQELELPNAGYALATGANSVSLSDDASRLAIGDRDSTDGSLNQGRAIVYLRGSGTYTQEDETFGNGDGYSQDLDDDANTWAVSQQLSAYLTIRTRSGTTWSDQQYIQSTDIDNINPFLPSRLMISADGNLMVSIAWQTSAPAYSFCITRSGSTWTKASKWYVDSTMGDLDPTFGDHLADLSSTGDWLIVGGQNATVSSQTLAGKCEVFSGSAGTYTSDRFITQPGGAEINAKFGACVAISGDGSFVCVTAPGSDNPNGTGRAWLFYL